MRSLHGGTDTTPFSTYKDIAAKVDQVISQWNPTTKKIYHASVNACLAPLVSVDGKHVITVEGIGNVKSPHPAQERIAQGNGSQCGFCTPGIVMVSGFGPVMVAQLTRLEFVCTSQELPRSF